LSFCYLLVSSFLIVHNKIGLMILDFDRRVGGSRLLGDLCLAVFLLVSLGLLSADLHALTAETQIDLSGTLQILVADDFAGHHVETIHYLEVSGTGQRFTLHFANALPSSLTSGTEARVQGRLLGLDIIVTNLDSTAVAPLRGHSGSAAVQGTHTPLVIGSQQTLVMLLNFTNAAVACSVSSVSNAVFSLVQSSVNTVYLETSFSNILWTGLVVGPYTIPYGYGACDPNGWADAADAAATAAGIAPNSFAHKVYVLPNSGTCGWGGLATIGGNPSRAWISSCNLIFQFAHEMGHGLGMNHSSTDPDNDNTILPSEEYGDASDFMSASYNLTRLNAPHLAQMAWLPADDSRLLVGSGTYQVAALELGPANSPLPGLLFFPIPVSSDSYYVSYRQPVGLDANLYSAYTPGVSLHRWCCGANTRLITILNDGGSFSDSASGFFLRQVSHNSSSATVTVEILATTPPVPPTITAMTMTPKGTFSLSGTGAVGRAYSLLTATTLALPIVWTPIATNTADANGGFTFSDPNAANFSRRFYRVQSQ
jgi:hypothetical protein